MAIEPHGNVLVNRVLKAEDAEKLKATSKNLQQISIGEELVKDVKNIARGVYSPLTGFMVQEDFERVVKEMKLADGTVWPIPFVLDVTAEVAGKIVIGEQVSLVDDNNNPIAVLNVRDKYTYEDGDTAKHVYGTIEDEHPGVKMIYDMEDYLIGGDIELIDNSKEPFNDYNLDPLETRLLFREKGWETITGFQTRNAPHKAHEYLQRIALELTDGLFINPVIGEKKAGDFKDEAILKAYDYMVRDIFPRDRSVLSILPLKMRYAGPREAVLHAIIRKNFGCTHFIVGRDHAGVGDYYGTYEAQEIFDTIDDIGISILKLEHTFHCKGCGTMASSKTCAHDKELRTGPSGTVIRQLLQEGKQVPEEIMRPDISDLLINIGDVFVD